jgi:hypothetical protein
MCKVLEMSKKTPLKGTFYIELLHPKLFSRMQDAGCRPDKYGNGPRAYSAKPVAE